MENNQDKNLSGRRSDFLSLLTVNYSRINSFIFCMVPNETDAEDIMQETTITMWEKFIEFKQGTDFVAWAVTIAKYKILEFRRSKKGSYLQLDDRLLELLENENKALFDDIDKKTRALRVCIKKLPKKDQNFILLRYSRGLTLKKLSQRIGVSVTAVYRHNAKLHALLLGCIRRQLAFNKI